MVEYAGLLGLYGGCSTETRYRPVYLYGTLTVHGGLGMFLECDTSQAEQALARHVARLNRDTPDLRRASFTSTEGRFSSAGGLLASLPSGAVEFASIDNTHLQIFNWYYYDQW